MKKTSLISMTLLLVFILATGTVFAETSGQTVNLVLGQSTAQINGKDVTMTAPAQVVSGSTLVPLRFVGEAFGCDVQWISDTRTAVVTMEDQTIEVPIGQTYAVINGEKIEVKVPGQLINGSTFVPLRFIGENLGAKVDYDATTKGISILLNTYKNKTHNFEMVLPTGWTVVTEDKDEVRFKNETGCEASFALNDETDGVLASEIDADELFKDLKAKDGFNSVIYDDAIMATYIEDGNTILIVYVMIDSGVYAAVFAAPTNSFTDAVYAQCDIMINSIKTYTAQ